MKKKGGMDGDQEGLDRTELESIKRVFERLDRKNDGKICRDEISQQFEILGYRPKKHTDYGTSEVVDMIWEVDEDCDGMIDWENFIQLYVRCRKDKSGCEPKRLFNLIEFMINDKDGSGTINEDEVMEVLYHRYGKEAMQKMTDEVFKNDRDGDKELDFQDFLAIVNAGMHQQAASRDAGGTSPIKKKK
uniref:EF-hand domain-containing protein n=1 Tax=Hemiselmis tepida TaxID=464990 RepID=A0A7S0YTP4_9CRYP|mmetsp:Transcript_21221/g.53392  ORF Transcript_21221/g.53392 Transcript_21221/m.53392 type:complete len:189 (+) Transcript_21221:51-617(+)